MNFDNARLFLDELSSAKAIQLLKSTSYYPSYRALLILASKAQDDPRDDGLLGLSFAVYGWMPTILKNWEFKNFGVENSIEVVKSLKTIDSAKDFLTRIDAISPVNGSWVGLSKLLHFLNPELFPIWDSRIAKQFGLNWAYQLNRKNVYISYFTFIHENLATQSDILTVVADHIENEHDYRPSAVRCLELLFFEATTK